MLGALSLIAMAVLHDYRTFKISNKLILGGFVFGLVIQFVKLLCGDSIMTSLNGLFISLTFGGVLYFVNAIGAGDAKIFMCLGLIIGADIFKVILVSLVLGLIIGVIENYFGSRNYIDAFGNGILMHKFHYSIAIFLAFCIVCVV